MTPMRSRGRRVLACFLALGCASCPAAPVAKGPTTAEALANHGRNAMEIYGEGPLGESGGSVAVAFLAEGGLSLVVREGASLKIHPLVYLDEPKFTLGFGDIDGDERADVIFFTPTFVQAYLTPKPGAESTGLSPDDAAGLAMLGSTSVADALARARTVPRRGVTVAEVCKLLGGIGKVSDLRKVATINFRLLSYEGSGPGGWAHAPQVKAIAHLVDEDAGTIGGRCNPDQRAAMDCTGGRPVCLAGSLADGTYLWFEWLDDRLMLAAAAVGTSK
jgi:hypothetical protein